MWEQALNSPSTDEKRNILLLLVQCVASLGSDKSDIGISGPFFFSLAAKGEANKVK